MILGAAYGTVADIEVVFTLIAAVGLAFSSYNLRDACRDLGAAFGLGLTNGRREIARVQVRLEVTRLAIQGTYVAIGALAMALPDPPLAAQPTLAVVAGAVLRWGLIASGALLLYQSEQNFRLRRILRHEVKTSAAP